MTSVQSRANTKWQTVRAVVTRADGTIEDLGVISYYHRNPLFRWAWRVKKFFKEMLT
jgi:hypothetical protein